jgi:circadian clock protein KaiC
MSNPTRKTREFIPTGVPGLDHVLKGGFIREGFYLLQADPGSGKTTIALQYVLGRLKAGEPRLYVTLTESRADLEDACASHGWSLDGLEVCDLTAEAAQAVGGSKAPVFHPAETELGDTTTAMEPGAPLGWGQFGGSIGPCVTNPTTT